MLQIVFPTANLLVLLVLLGTALLNAPGGAHYT